MITYMYKTSTIYFLFMWGHEYKVFSVADKIKTIFMSNIKYFVNFFTIFAIFLFIVHEQSHCRSWIKRILCWSSHWNFYFFHSSTSCVKIMNWNSIFLFRCLSNIELENFFFFLLIHCVNLNDLTFFSLKARQYVKREWRLPEDVVLLRILGAQSPDPWTAISILTFIWNW